jgi:hypothetical protein
MFLLCYNMLALAVILPPRTSPLPASTIPCGWCHAPIYRHCVTSDEMHTGWTSQNFA